MPELPASTSKDSTPRFRLVTGDGALRRVFELSQPKIRIGTDPSCDVRLLPGECAPFQAEIQLSGDQLLLFHHGGEVPTRVSRHPVQVAHLQGGEQITLGHRSFRIESAKGPFGNFFFASAAAASLHDDPALHREYSSSFAESLRSAVQRTPFLLLSLLVHLIILLLISQTPIRDKEGDSVSFRTGFAPDPEEQTDIESDTDDLLDPEVEPQETPSLDPVLMEAKETTPVGVEEAPLEDTSLTSGLGSFTAMPGAGALSSATSAGFRNLVGKLRATGLDLVILFDSTGSMEDFLHEVKRDIARMIDVISLIVPDFRIGLVTYKGTADFGRTTIAQGLTRDRYEVMNFLDHIDSRGGSQDARAAVAEGLKRCIQEMRWRLQAEKVIVLIGDAPPFVDDRTKVKGYAHQFDGRLSSIYKASGGITEDRHYDETVKVWRDLARRSGEFSFYDGEGAVVRRLVYAALGSDYAISIDQIFQSRSDGWQKHIVGRKLKNRDYDWIFSKLLRRRVHPAVVEGLTDIGGHYVAERALVTLNQKAADNPWIVPRLVHILRRVTLDNTIDFDVDGSEIYRERRIEELRDSIENAFPSSRRAMQGR